MRISSVQTLVLSVPFDDGGHNARARGEGIMPSRWNHLDFCLVRIETDSGLVGWGEAFSYFCSRSVAAMIESSIRPLLEGRELPDPPSFFDEAQRKLVLQGRRGVTVYALSGVDLAMWDLIAKAQGVSLGSYLAEQFQSQVRVAIPAYASLVRYGDPKLVAEKSIRAAGEGFPEIKLHEVDLDAIRAAREAIGNAIPLHVDVNCQWTEAFTREAIPQLIELNTRWLEEPIFPPEDYQKLAELRKLGLPIATGENACTAFEMRQIGDSKACDYLQPSVTKLGGISEFLAVAKENRERWKIPLMPHSPYFGPGYMATLQLASCIPEIELFEYLYIQPTSWLYPEMPLPQSGQIPIPDGPGLGPDPDIETIDRFLVAK